MKELSYEKTIARVGITTIIWNILLSLAKVIAGFFAKSNSLISDGIHSASDVFTTVIVIIGAKISRKNADEDHPFGHERLESVASIILAGLLAATAISIGYSGVNAIIDIINGKVSDTNTGIIYLALGCAITSIIVKAWMYFYTIKASKKINSNGLKADAFHHLTDSLSSIGSALGIVGLMIGNKWAILDPIASIIITLFILKVSYDILKDAIDQLVDKSAPEELNNSLKEIVSNEGIILDSLRTRQFGNKYYVELEIAIDDNLTVKEGHSIAQKIHDEIEGSNENIKHCMIHVNPLSEQNEY